MFEEGGGMTDGDSCLCNCAFLTHREKNRNLDADGDDNIFAIALS